MTPEQVREIELSMARERTRNQEEVISDIRGLVKAYDLTFDEAAEVVKISTLKAIQDRVE